jgi:para-aminobenzoate synthetase/4-amino-4-deoxychorismate lyase
MYSFSDTEITGLTSWLEERREFVFLDTSRVSREDHQSFLFLDPVAWLTCGSRNEAAGFFAEAGNLQRQGYFLAGWFAYEFGYLLEPSLAGLLGPSSGPLALLGVFRDPVIFDHRLDNSRAVESLAGKGTFPDRGYSLRDLQTSISRDAYRRAIAAIKGYLAAGDTYQVNYTMKLSFGFGGSPASFYRALRRGQSVAFGAWIRKDGRDIMSFSPELFFRAETDRITVRPMKGTMSRGRTAADDPARMEALRSDGKNRSENVMIVDLLRNDLGHFLHNTGGGRVMPLSLFDVEVYETLLQMTSTVEGKRAVRQGPDLRALLTALFPCGSVTGAPKIRTMRIIHELEREPRGVYCGAIGWCSEERAVFNVPIRTVVLDGRKGEMGVGSGIVTDSDAEVEWEECILKGGFLTNPTPAFQLIETLLWRPETGYWLLEEHLERLAGSAAYFFFRFDRELVEKRLAREVKGCTAPRRVRLLLHRDGRLDVTSAAMAPVEPPPAAGYAQSLPLPAVRFSRLRTDPGNIHLFHKTTLRQLYERERRRALEEGYFEVLFLNLKGEATEGSVTNIFIRRQGRLLTPPVASGLLAGTFRRFLLEKGEAEEQILSREDILSADAVFVGNSVRGLVRVRAGD